MRFITEEKLMEELLFPGRDLVVVIGGADTGKTTLIERMADVLSRVLPVAVVDLDTGQSHIGPPTTIAWGVVSGGFRGWEKIKAEDLYFTGALSPAGSMLQALVGAHLMVRRARTRCARVLVDTTGMVFEPLGRIFKQYKMELLSPDAVVTLERKDELRTILEALKAQDAATFRMRVPEEARPKTAARRRNYRARKFREYFKGSRALRVSLRETALRFTGERAPLKKELLLGRLASLRTLEGRDLALGIILDVDAVKKEVRLKTPFSGGEEFVTLAVGSGEARLLEEL